jgi:hypothetical protein
MNLKLAKFKEFTGKLFQGKYTSARSAGDYLAGYNAATGRIQGPFPSFMPIFLPPPMPPVPLLWLPNGGYISQDTAMKLAGALHKGGINPSMALEILLYGTTPYSGTYYGEIEYSGRRIAEGFIYGVTQR